MLNVISGLLGEGTPPVTSSYESIASYTVGSGGVASFTFSSIPSTYKHLQIRHIVAANPASNPVMRFNGDTSSNYNWHYLQGDGSSASSGTTGSSTTSILAGVPPTSTYFQAGIIDILDYADTNKYKTTRWFEGSDQNGSGQIGLFSGLWRNTSAINSITLGTGSTNLLLEKSTFALYGIKG